ncbi:hypothetical protein AVEN_13296-1 [Araneus ventricosus]|uniref:Uncharacterized protein n=1 Tax=Araneus ventricosus TaxID=182803 RepID=A0A4Y2EXI1_ARAVE|nr:hypothetical protein AVEN_13296-1 [Araneus ventricosus]
MVSDNSISGIPDSPYMRGSPASVEWKFGKERRFRFYDRSLSSDFILEARQGASRNLNNNFMIHTSKRVIFGLRDISQKKEWELLEDRSAFNQSRTILGVTSSASSATGDLGLIEEAMKTNDSDLPVNKCLNKPSNDI